MKKMFEKSTLSGITLKNRFFRSATYEKMANEDGHLNNEIISIYKDLSKGGVGTIIGSYAYILKEEQPSPKMMGIYDNSFIEDYKKLGDIAHSYGAKYIQQIVYGGSQTTFNIGKRIILGPSSVENKNTKVIPVEMTKKDINIIVKAFGNAAKICKESGLDGVEIHAAHGYLLSQFLSPYYNRRTDEYGGSLENRARIIVEVYEEVRRQVGYDKNFVVGIKINSSDFDIEGATFEECKYTCNELDKRGIDFVEVSGASSYKYSDVNYKESVFRKYAVELSKNLKSKVILVCKNRNINTMEEILNNSKVEYFSIARPLVCEPDLINNWSSDNNYSAKCVYCGQCLSGENLKCKIRK